MDVGGVGSMLRPFLKNVPVINRILPDKSDEEVMEETGYKYKNLAEAVDRIKELEDQLAQYQNNGAADSDQIAQLKAEVERLKVYEDNQENFLKQKEEFDREVVFTDNAPDIEEYKKWCVKRYNTHRRFRTGLLHMLLWMPLMRLLLCRR